MRVRTHGLYPHKMGIWVPIKDLSATEAFHYYLSMYERVNEVRPSKEKEKPEAKTVEKFDDNFMNQGFRILSANKTTVMILHKHDFRYTLLCARKEDFVKAWNKHYSGNPKNIASY